MNREDIIRMAREAEVEPMLYDGKWAVTNLDRFAALVAAAERECCAQLCDHMWNTWLDSSEDEEQNKPDAEDCAKAIRKEEK